MERLFENSTCKTLISCTRSCHRPRPSSPCRPDEPPSFLFVRPQCIRPYRRMHDSPSSTVSVQSPHSFLSSPPRCLYPGPECRPLRSSPPFFPPDSTEPVFRLPDISSETSLFFGCTRQPDLSYTIIPRDPPVYSSTSMACLRIDFFRNKQELQECLKNTKDDLLPKSEMKHQPPFNTTGSEHPSPSISSDVRPI